MVQSLRESTESTLKLIFTEYKISQRNLKAFIYINNGQFKDIIEERAPFKVRTKERNYLGINNMQNHRKKISCFSQKGNSSTWKGILYSWVGRLHIIYVPVLCKLLYKFNAIPRKIPRFSKHRKLIPKFLWKKNQD